MAISSVGSNARPGVCTSTTRPTTPFEGQLIYETDTNRVLVWEGAAWVMIADTDSPPGMQHISTQTFSAQTQVDFSDVFTSEFSSYSIVLHEYTCTQNGEMVFRLRDSGGVVATANYDMSRLESTGTAGVNPVVNPFTFVAASNWTMSFVVASGTAGAAIAGAINVYRPNDTTYTRFTSSIIRTDNATGTLYNVTSAGSFRLTTQMTGFSLIRAGTGTITGRVSVYGYRN